MKDARDSLMVGRTTDGRLVQRPLSPHLQVYRPQITSALSIFHRATGMALAVGTLLLTWWLVAAATSDGAYNAASGFMRSWLGLLLLFAWSFTLCFHLCTGLRHLAWDLGWGFELPQVHATGRLAVIAGAVLTVLAWIGIVAAF